jgi:hypothetical protein
MFCASTNDNKAKSKHVFFEKKKQKAFILKSKSFLLPFFKKEVLPS